MENIRNNQQFWSGVSSVVFGLGLPLALYAGEAQATNHGTPETVDDPTNCKIVPITRESQSYFAERYDVDALEHDLSESDVELWQRICSRLSSAFGVEGYSIEIANQYIKKSNGSGANGLHFAEGKVIALDIDAPFRVVIHEFLHALMSDNAIDYNVLYSLIFSPACATSIANAPYYNQALFYSEHWMCVRDEFPNIDEHSATYYGSVSQEYLDLFRQYHHARMIVSERGQSLFNNRPYEGFFEETERWALARDQLERQLAALASTDPAQFREIITEISDTITRAHNYQPDAAELSPDYYTTLFNLALVFDHIHHTNPDTQGIAGEMSIIDRVEALDKLFQDIYQLHSQFTPAR